MRNISYHSVTEVSIDTIQHIDLTPCEPFYTRTLVIKMADGSTESIHLFSDDGHNLLVSDPDLSQMMSEVLKKAA